MERCTPGWVGEDVSAQQQGSRAYVGGFSPSLRSEKVSSGHRGSHGGCPAVCKGVGRAWTGWLPMAQSLQSSVV